jgi:hypothetical protein
VTVEDNTDAGQRPANPASPYYEENPGHVRLACSVLCRHASARDVHERFTRRFVEEDCARLPDVGCGKGNARHPPDGAWTGLDTGGSDRRLLPVGPEVELDLPRKRKVACFRNGDRYPGGHRPLVARE